VEYEDRITIWAPEGIELEYTLAGLGSRFLAAAVDVLLCVVVLGALIGLLAALGASRVLLLITLIVGGFLALFAYWIVFEVWAAGRTPGKRLSGLRVLMASGQPVTFAPSAVRNVMRIVDIYATAAVVGIVSIASSKRDQRLGDLAASTIVVRERRDRDRGVIAMGTEPATAQAVVDVTAVTAAELAAIRDFLGRRERLTTESRARVSRALADSIETKVGGLPPGSMSAEDLLETVVAAKSGRAER
jgi:uncharacterized RDD family membrane protein YckC